VIAPATGGAPEFVFAEAAEMIDPDAPDEAIADRIAALHDAPERLSAMAHAAWSRRHEALWSSSMAQMSAFWPYVRRDAHCA
jgi:hypothetical protein